MVQRRSPEGVTTNLDQVAGTAVAIGNTQFGGGQSGIYLGNFGTDSYGGFYRYNSYTPTRTRFEWTTSLEAGMPWATFSHSVSIATPTQTATLDLAFKWYPPGSPNLTASSQYSPSLPTWFSTRTTLTTGGNIRGLPFQHTITPNTTFRVANFGTVYNALGRYGTQHRFVVEVATTGGGPASNTQFNFFDLFDGGYFVNTYLDDQGSISFNF